MRFSLSTVLVVITIGALTLAARIQYSQKNQIREFAAQLEERENYSRLQGRINEFVRSLDPDSEEDLETFRLVRRLIPSAPSSVPAWDTHTPKEAYRERFQQLTDVDGDAGWLEVLSLSYRPLVPFPEYTYYSVNVLFNGHEVVDVLVVGPDQWTNLDDTQFDDCNGDGILDVIVHKHVMLDKEVTRYCVASNGFSQQLDGMIEE